jgi:ParB-like chromosome segregation protein Spo0J
VAAVPNSNSAVPADFPVNSELEAELTRSGIPFKRDAAFPLARIRVLEQAQVRSEGERAPKDYVERYSTQMRSGAVFPALVLHESADSSTVVDGHTRIVAAKKERRSTFAAYVLSGQTSISLRVLGVMLNQRNGKALADTDVARSVREFIRDGMSSERIAFYTGYSRTTIDRMIQALNFDDRTAALGIEIPDKSLKQTAKATLAREIPHEPVFAEAVKLSRDAGLVGTDIAQITTAVKQAKSDAEALSFIAGERERRADQIVAHQQGRTQPRPSFVQQWRMHAAPIVRLRPEDVIDTNPDRRADSIEMAKSMLEFCRQLVGLYDAGSHGSALAAD